MYSTHNKDSYFKSSKSNKPHGMKYRVRLKCPCSITPRDSRLVSFYGIHYFQNEALQYEAR